VKQEKPMPYFTKSALSVLVATAVVAFAVPAEAKKRKVARTNATENGIPVPARYKDPTLFPKGPLYFAGVYMGDDPDPFIRFQIMREISAKFGGAE
jgi:hypothetical protein